MSTDFSPDGAACATNRHLRGERQPLPDSIVRVGGARGTVYQRFDSDGNWHGTNGQVRSWLDLIMKPSHVEVLHDAPQRLEIGSIYMNTLGDIYVIETDGSYVNIRPASGLPADEAWSLATKVFTPVEGII